MRTTVELPPELLRAAKARSAESGESLKSLITRAVAAELHVHPTRTGQDIRIRLPLFGTAGGVRVRVSNADLERALAEADAGSVRTIRTSRRPRQKTR